MIIICSIHNMEIQKKCWLCSNTNVALSLCPQSTGRHKKNYSMQKWIQANKQVGKKYVINGIIIQDYSKTLCSNICFDCAH